MSAVYEFNRGNAVTDSYLDTPAKADAPDKKVSERLWIDPDNAEHWSGQKTELWRH
jgi:hypothetical protein